MKNAEYGLTENLIFKEAVAFLKKKKPAKTPCLRRFWS